MCLHTFCLDTHHAASRATRSGGATPRRPDRHPMRLRLGAILLVTQIAAVHVASAGEPVIAHGNTLAAGSVGTEGVTIRLRAASGRWRREGATGPALNIDALGEEGGPLSVPAPLIRVTEGTTLTVSVRNELRAPLRLHGLCAREGDACPPLDVPPGARETVRFPSARAGTYHYWATSLAAPMPMREMAGAFIVDPARGAEPDRIFVITEWNTLTASEVAEILSADLPSEQFLAVRPALTFVINGLSWPATERLTYRRGAEVRWRVINLSSQPHPMHLHGFHFTVLTSGDGRRDGAVAGGRGEEVVTHVLPPAGTMTMRWTPAQEGNWLFHCHIMAHVSPARRLAGGAVAVGDPPPPHSHAAGGHDPSLGMAGMVLGITVLPPNGNAPAAATPPAAARQLTMHLTPTAGRAGAHAIGIAISDRDGRVPSTPPTSPGPPLVLVRGEPVEITVVNGLAEATSVHWHGLEIESFYDGVHGWSGTGGRTAPLIEPGRSFVARITPPRAGTFIYHTHLHDYHQLSAGLYGALLVTEPGTSYDPSVDHVVVLGRQHASEAASILQDPASVVLNGDHAPRWTWTAGTRHRIRIVNITPDDVFVVSVARGDSLVEWRALMKDGAPSPTAPAPARVRIAVGETYDFEIETPSGRGLLWIEVRSPNGKWQAQGQVVVR